MLVIQLLAEKKSIFIENQNRKKVFRLIETFRLFIKTFLPHRFIFMSACNVVNLQKSCITFF